jgi:large subunit ribosomal protein L5
MSLYDRMKSEVIPAVKKELNLKNDYAVPKISKVKVDVGIGSLSKQTKDFSEVVENVSKICGQKPVIMKAKKAISNFKLRQGVPVGVTATLRGRRAYDMVERLVSIVLPRVRDFRGLSIKSFDGNGNYTIGFKEALVFPEISPDDVTNVHGIQITIVTTSKDNKGGIALLKQIGFPFKKEL